MIIQYSNNLFYIVIILLNIDPLYESVSYQIYLNYLKITIFLKYSLIIQYQNIQSLIYSPILIPNNILALYNTTN